MVNSVSISIITVVLFIRWSRDELTTVLYCIIISYTWKAITSVFDISRLGSKWGQIVTYLQSMPEQCWVKNTIIPMIKCKTNYTLLLGITIYIPVVEKNTICVTIGRFKRTDFTDSRGSPWISLRALPDTHWERVESMQLLQALNWIVHPYVYCICPFFHKSKNVWHPDICYFDHCIFKMCLICFQFTFNRSDFGCYVCKWIWDPLRFHKCFPKFKPFGT